MKPPYAIDEVSRAVIEAARGRGLPLREVEVRADTTRRVWSVRISEEQGAAHALTLPFATARGICSPAEIAACVLGGSWPFGGAERGE